MSRIGSVRALVALSLAFAFANAHAQVGSGAVTYAGSGVSQDFNTLAATSTSSTLPTGWYFAETDTNANTTYTAADGSGASISGDTYSFGASGNTERAFGGVQSSSLIPSIGARITNSTGAVLTQLQVQYVGEQWRLGATGRNDRLDFQYSVDATALNNGTWLDFNALDFVAPISAGTVGGLNGNSAANQAIVSSLLTGISVANGGSLWVRWTDSNATGADDGLAIDDVVFGTLQDNPPVVTTSTPAHTAFDVPVDTPFSITFSEPVDTIGTWFTFSCGADTPTLTPSAGPASTFTLTPSGALGYSRLCNLTVLATQVRDLDGTQDFMAFNEQIQFETVADNLPEVSSTTPLDTATDVARAANLTVTFNEPVTALAAAFSIECPVGTPRPFALSTEDNTLFVLDPSADLPASTGCSLHVDNLQVTDQDGTADNPDRNTLINFTTAAVAPPAVFATVPVKNATNFPPAGDLQVVFDASVNLGPGAFALVCAQTSGISLSHGSSGTTFAISTGTVLVEGDTCTLTIEADAVTSGDGLHPTGDEVVNFTVAATSASTYWQNVNLSSPAQLRCSVHQTIRNHTALTYTQAWEVLEAGEEDPANAARVLDAYRNCSYLAGPTGDRVGGSGAGATCTADANERYNREHTWPNSLGFPNSSLAPYTDTHMLYATDEGYNNSRGSKPYANCPSGCNEEPTSVNNGVGGGTGVYPGNSNWYDGSSYEVWNHRKGDMARAVMYMAIRYEGGDNAPDLELTDTRALIVGHSNTDPVAYMGLLSTLLQWNTFDPPDQREQDRNAIVQTYQGNRNPFIDHPEWATAGLFGSVTPAMCVLNTNAPAANDDTYNTAIDTVLNTALTPANDGVLSNDSDVEGAPLSAQLVSDVASGTLALVANGDFSYTPPAGFCGTRSFTYRASDGVRLSTPRMVTINVGSSCAGNSAPTFTSTALTGATEDQLYSYSITATDANGDTMTISAPTKPIWMTLTPTGNGSATLSGTPTNAEVGSHPVVLQVSDGIAAPVQQSFSVTVSNVNDAPTANDATFALAENSAATTVVGTVTGSDPDASTTLTYSITGGNGSGAFAISSGGQITVANAGPLNFETTPQFVLTVQASDGALTDTAQVTVNLSNVNEAPTANDATFALAENSAATTVVGTVTGSDPDASTTLTYSITGGNGSGAFAMSGSQLFVANSSPLDYGTTPQFVLTVTVSDGALSDSATVRINLTNVLETVANDDHFTHVTEDSSAVSLDVMANDVPDDGGGPFVLSTGAPALHGTVTVTQISLEYAPAANYCGPDSFTYVNNGDTATVTLEVQCSADAPTVAQALVERIAQEGVEIATFSIASGFADADVGDDLDFAAQNLPAGLMLDAETGQISGTPAPGSSAGSVYTVVITATDGNASVQQSFQYTVAPATPGDPHIFGNGFEGN